MLGPKNPENTVDLLKSSCVLSGSFFRRLSCVSASCSVALFSGSSALAAPIAVYTDRASFEAAVQPDVFAPFDSFMPMGSTFCVGGICGGVADRVVQVRLDESVTTRADPTQGALVLQYGWSFAALGWPETPFTAIGVDITAEDAMQFFFEGVGYLEGPSTGTGTRCMGTHSRASSVCCSTSR